MVLTGLMAHKSLDFDRIAALGNVTEDNLARGLGLGEKFSLKLEIKITESNDNSRINSVLFSEVLKEVRHKPLPLLSKKFKLVRKILIILEVHNGGRKANNSTLQKLAQDPCPAHQNGLSCTIRIISLST